MQAARKAPHFALGFRVEVLKWVTLVRLLLGEIPERSSLQQKGMQQSMLPYLDITQAVRDVTSTPAMPHAREEGLLWHGGRVLQSVRHVVEVVELEVVERLTSTPFTYRGLASSQTTG